MAALATVAVSCIVYIYCVLQNSSVLREEGVLSSGVFARLLMWMEKVSCSALPQLCIWYTDGSRLDILVIFTVSQATG